MPRTEPRPNESRLAAPAVCDRSLPDPEGSAPASSGAPERLLGDWALGESLGQGAFATVYRARPRLGPRHLPAAHAVKLLRPEWEARTLGLQMLRREAEVSRSVTHPHLAPVLSARWKTPPYYIVMPLLGGETLSRRLAERPLPAATTVGIVRQASQALEALHSHGWVHGDVKPGNVLVTPTGHATLFDLGFARRSGERHLWTESGEDLPAWTGTLSYLAPETLTSAEADPRSDLYSLGVTLYEALLGERPFRAANPGELLRQHRESRPAEIRTRRPELPRELSELIRALLAKNPWRRPPSAEEVTRRLTSIEIAMFATDREMAPRS